MTGETRQVFIARRVGVQDNDEYLVDIFTDTLTGEVTGALSWRPIGSTSWSPVADLAPADGANPVTGLVEEPSS